MTNASSSYMIEIHHIQGDSGKSNKQTIIWGSLVHDAAVDGVNTVVARPIIMDALTVA